MKFRAKKRKFAVKVKQGGMVKNAATKSRNTDDCDNEKYDQ